MITLNVEKYCANCPHFEAHVEKTSIESFFDNDCDGIYNTDISCENASKCREIYKTIKKNPFLD